MQLYDKLKPLLEEYYRLNDEWWARGLWRAAGNPGWSSRQQELKERRQELQRQIMRLTQKDRTLINQGSVVRNQGSAARES